MGGSYPLIDYYTCPRLCDVSHQLCTHTHETTKDFPAENFEEDENGANLLLPRDASSGGDGPKDKKAWLLLMRKRKILLNGRLLPRIRRTTTRT